MWNLLSEFLLTIVNPLFIYYEKENGIIMSENLTNTVVKVLETHQCLKVVKWVCSFSSMVDDQIN